MRETIELGEAGVHVWGIEPCAVTDAALLQRYEGMLSPDEHERRMRLRLERARHDYLVAHALLRASLSRYAEVAPEAWTFETNRHGRPEIRGPAGIPPLRFNLSHTNGLVVCALTLRRAIGIDVEDRFRPMRFMEVARRFFAPPEVEALSAVPEDQRRTAFYRFWTLKEAYIKGLGLGLSVPLASFWFRLDDDETATLSLGDPASDRRRWQFSHLRPTERHLVALAVEQTTAEPPRVRLQLAIP